MGFFSGDTDTIYPSYKPQAHAKPAIGYLTNLMNQEVNLPTQKVAGMSANEQMGQSALADIMAGKSFQDPSTSQYYTGMRNQMKTATNEGVSALRNRQQGTGMYNSGGAVNQESKYRQGMSDQQMTLLGQLYEQERARDNEYTRLAAANQYGALPRLLEQMGMDASYNAAMGNIEFPYQYQMPAAQSLLNYDANVMGQTVANPSGFSQWAPLIGTAVGAIAGGPAGAAMGSQLGSSLGGATSGAGNNNAAQGLPAGWGQTQGYNFPTTTPSSSGFSLGQGYFQ